MSSPVLSERRVRSGVRMRKLLSWEVRRPRAERPAIDLELYFIVVAVVVVIALDLRATDAFAILIDPNPIQ